MKFHVFIATTQGVVAIQDVIPLNDPEIHSLISVNGTATVANISANYHHFVKKGSGIIHQDFSCCSYRINISERIDQGNSWQLAIYLAHILADKNLLTYGDIKADDQIIIATGEVNTANRNIQSVEHVQEKYNHIIEFFADLQNTHIAVKSFKNKPLFFIPENNRHDIKPQTTLVDVCAISQLSALPSKIAELTLEDAYQQKELHHKEELNKPISFKNLCTSVYGKVLATLLLIILLTVLGINGWNSSEDRAEDFKQETTLIEPLPNTNPTKQSDKRTSNFVEKYSLKTTYAQYQNCSEETKERLYFAVKQKFASTNRHKLCQLSFVTPANVKQVYWLNNNKTPLLALKPLTIPVNKSDTQEWLIPLPEKQQRDMSYFLIVLVNENNNQSDKNNSLVFQQQLKSFLAKNIQSPKVTQKQLTAWLTHHKNKQSKIYSHKLEVF